MTPITIGLLKAWTHPPTSGAPKARLLLVHGLGEHSDRHRNTVEYLRRQGIEVVRFDLRGSGASGGDRQWIERFDDYVDDVGALVGHISREMPSLPLFLYGHSLGGAIAIHYAARAETPLAGLVLSAPAYLPGAGVSSLKVAVGRLIARVAPRMRIPGTLDLSAISRDPAIADAYRKDPLCDTFNTVRQGSEILDALEKVPEKCARIRVPTLILHGGADRIIRPEGSRKVYEALAATDKRLEVLPGGFHELYNDLDKEKFFAIVGEFLSRHL